MFQPNAPEKAATLFGPCSLLAALLAVGGLGLDAQRSGGQSVALVGGTLIDGSGGAPVSNAVVVTRGDRIVAVGTVATVSIPADAQVIDTKGQFLLPGLIDSHIHYADWMPGELFLGFGVTTFVNYGPAVKRPHLPDEDGTRWPRTFHSVGTIASPDETTVLGRSEPGRVTNEQQAREEVRKYHAQDALFIKVNENLSTKFLAAVCDEAHKLGLPVVGHQVNAREALQGGMDGIEHLTGIGWAAITDRRLLDDLRELNRARGPARAPISHPISNPEYHMDRVEARRILSLMVEKKAFLNPTLVTRWDRIQPRTSEFREQYRLMAGRPEWQSVPQKVRDSWSQTLMTYPEWPDKEHQEQERIGYQRTQQFLREFVKAGGRMFSGTDVAGASVPGLRLHQELLLLVDAGLTPSEAILTATRYPAELYRIDKDLGTIAPGKFADILIVGADPLKRVQHLKRIRHVMANGRLVPIQFDPELTEASSPAGG